MLTQLLPLSLTYILVGVGIIGTKQVVSSNQWLWIAGWLPLAFLILFVAPYKLWKGQRDKVDAIEEQLRPKLVLSIEHEPVSTNLSSPISDRGRFWRIKVENMGSSPLNRCYGAIRYCSAIDENGNSVSADIVRAGHPLPWARQTIGINQSGGWWEATVGTVPAYIDYIMIQNEGIDHLNIPSRQNPSQDRPEFREFEVFFKKLKFQIVVASHESPNSPSVITFQFDWHGGFATTIKDTS